ncbi:MAG: hypothetical protein VKP62_15650 [Candidatus Sericytochromatia bacterium]|nr:hypothetical protein [Candidatus Sericytochromatia bacterium]
MGTVNSGNGANWKPAAIGRPPQSGNGVSADFANDAYNNSGVKAPAPLDSTGPAKKAPAAAKKKAQAQKAKLAQQTALTDKAQAALKSQNASPKPSIDAITLPGAEPAAQTEAQAVDALIKMANAKKGPTAGMVSKDDVMKLPDGPAKETILANFAVLQMSTNAGSEVGKGIPRGVEQKTEAWTHLTVSDLNLMKNQLKRGDTLESFADKVAAREIAKDDKKELGQYHVGDRNGDGVKDKADLKAYVEELQKGPRHQTEGRYEQFSR